MKKRGSAKPSPKKRGKKKGGWHFSRRERGKTNSFLARRKKKLKKAQSLGGGEKVFSLPKGRGGGVLRQKVGGT